MRKEKNIKRIKKPSLNDSYDEENYLNAVEGWDKKIKIKMSQPTGYQAPAKLILLQNIYTLDGSTPTKLSFVIKKVKKSQIFTLNDKNLIKKFYEETSGIELMEEGIHILRAIAYSEHNLTSEVFTSQ